MSLKDVLIETVTANYKKSISAQNILEDSLYYCFNKHSKGLNFSLCQKYFSIWKKEIQIQFYYTVTPEGLLIKYIVVRGRTNEI